MINRYSSHASSNPTFDLQLSEWKGTRVLARLPAADGAFASSYGFGTILAARNNKDVAVQLDNEVLNSTFFTEFY